MKGVYGLCWEFVRHIWVGSIKEYVDEYCELARFVDLCTAIGLP